jgi:hypothetical protein
MLNGQGLASGYVALVPVHRLDFRKPEVLRLASVRWKIGDQAEELDDPLPRVRLVSETRISGDPNTDLDRIDPKQVALVESLLPVEPGPRGRAELSLDEPGHIRVETFAPTRQFLVVSERFHDGWTVRIDGRTHRVFRSYGDFMGCVVGPGRHEVEFRYQPRSFAVGARISVLSAVGVALLVWIGRRKSRIAWTGQAGQAASTARRRVLAISARRVGVHAARRLRGI